MALEEFAEQVIALIRHKDVFKKQIQEIIQKSDSTYEIKYADKTMFLTLSPTFKEVVPGTIVCESSRKNVDAVVAAWESLIKQDTIIIFFDKKTGGNWSLTPKVHQRIMGSDNVSKGLKSIYANCT